MKKHTLELLKQLYLGKQKQLCKTDARLNVFKHQILQAELFVIEAAIAEHELSNLNKAKPN